jgi:outer membrane protein OmpA-like peptidoglycan-associated protein
LSKQIIIKLKITTMATEVQDDYLDCGAYKANTGNKSATYPGFITFSESNGDHFFAWVNGDEIVMRSEAYPNAEKMERGIKAILKNCDLPERYAVIQGEGGYLLVMYGGGDHQKHTGNFENHSEIGRSCPHASREALNALLSFKGQDFADKVVPITRAAASTSGTATAAAAGVAAAATAAVAAGSASAANTAASHASSAASTATSYASQAVTETAGSSLGWLKWALPLLLVGGLGYWWFNRDKDASATATPADTSEVAGDTANGTTPADTTNTTAVVATKEATMVKLADGVELNAYKGGIEDQLVTFLNNKDAVIDTANKKANWYNFDDLNFVFGKNEITEASKKQIGNLVAVMKAYPNFKFKIGAYTDKKGNDASNMKLSQGRAETVLAAIKAAGGDVSRIVKAEGYGETLAEVPETATDEERLKDRRTAIRVVAK